MSQQPVVTVPEARRLFIHKQRLDSGDTLSMLQLIRDLGCVQLDPIQVVDKSHRLVLWSRLGAYDPAELDRIRWDDRHLFEYWAHAASMVLTEDFPLHQFRMQRLRSGKGRWAQRQKEWFASDPDVLLPLRDHILQRLKAEKGLRSRDFASAAGKRPSRWSNNRYVTRLLDYLWSIGEITVVGRDKMDRVWGLMEDFLPPWTPAEEWSPLQVTRFAARKSLRALGVATKSDIYNNFTRRVYPELDAVLDEFFAAGEIIPVSLVDHDQRPLRGAWYVHQEDVPVLETLRNGEWRPRTTLLSPFDNLICLRRRTELLFNFHYRIEIYVPAAKREYGYYVLPILHGDQLIGRINPKMDRSSGTLHIYNLYIEPDVERNNEMLTAVRAAIHDLAAFLGAERIEWGDLPWGWAKLKK